MSQQAKSTKTAVGPKLPTVPVYELLPPVTVLPKGIDPSTLLFPEWSDTDINAEKWDLPKEKANLKGLAVLEEVQKFTDQHIVRMPESLTEELWKRPEQIFIQCNLVIYKEFKNYPDLVNGSTYLLHSEFVRNFISAIGILHYLTDNRPSPIEFTTTTYVPTTDGMPWRPWHHIYSMCKGGKGQKHNPLVNQLGKYVVRLFWMGSWRKITIDDTLPIGYNCVLLPSLIEPLFTKKFVELSTSFSHNKLIAHSTTDIELWPFLLCKALLKLSNLTQTKSNELLDFDIIHCLTGWFPYKIEVLGINAEDVWEMCAGYSDHYTWSDPMIKSSVSGSKSSKSTAVPNFVDDDNSSITPFHLVGVCADMKQIKENIIPDITPCWSHNFLIDQTRNIPLLKPEPLPKLAPWKQFRWLDWAIRKGIWHQPDSGAIKSIKIVSDFKKCAKCIKFGTPGQESIDIQNNVLMIKDTIKINGNLNTKQQHENTDGSVWVDFIKIAPHLSHLYLYFKLSHFKNVTRITNILQKDDEKDKANKAKGGKLPILTVSKLLIWNNKLLCSRNEPIYIFCDSLDYKLIVINLAQEGNVDALNNRSTINAANTVPITYVLIEDYNWRSQKISDTVIPLKTYGNKTLLMEIKPGRFVFRMWLKSKKSFFIHVMSDSEIEIGSLEYVLEYMSHESEKLMKFCDDVSSCYGQLVQKIGTSSYKDALKLFYKSYLPENRLTKAQLITIHNNFIKEFVKIVKERSSKDDLKNRIFALKVLFLNPKIEIDCNDLCYDSNLLSTDTQSNETIKLAKKKQKAAIILQTAFRKFFVVNLRRIHDQKHQNHLKNFEQLKNIYNDIFSISNRMVVCADLLRNFLLNNSAMLNISQEYSLLKDLKSTIHLKHLMGTIQICPNNWIPINQYVFYCNSAYPTTTKIYLFCNLSNYIVRVFNNDTKKEITRITNSVIVNDYESNIGGYTVLCYGWSDFEGECQWKLNLATVKTQSSSTIAISDNRLINNVIRQIYSPNVNNYICRCTIKIEHDVVFSFRLSTTYKNVVLRLRCLNEGGQVIADISGKTTVILPAVLLYYVSTNLNKRQVLHSTTSVSSKEIKSKTKINSLKSKKQLRNVEKLSLDRRPSKASLIVDKSSIDNIKIKETTYLVEGFVLNDSWPLTKNEWLVVEEFKNKSLLGSTSNSIHDNQTSSKSGRKSLEKKLNLNLFSVSPYWILEVISNTDDQFVIEIDNSRQEEINDIKRKWYENDLDRYTKSKQLREQFLDSHYIKMETDLSLKEDIIQEGSLTTVSNSPQHEKFPSKIFLDETTRTLIKPEDSLKTLPQFDLMDHVKETDLKYVTNIDNAKRRVLTVEVKEELLNKQNEKIKKFEEYYKRYKEDMCNFLNEQTGRYKLLNDFFKKCGNESKELMTYAYSVRNQVINKIIDDSLAVATDDFF